MTNKELFYFTGKCLTINEHPEFRNEIIEKCNNECIDWQLFVALCSNHLILPVIYLKFKSQDLLEYLPVELSEHLAEIYQLNLLRNGQILNQIRKINAVLNSNNIFPVYLKGVGNLLDGLYSDLGERILGDIDLLVSESDYLESARLIKDSGYSEVFANQVYVDVCDLKHYPRLFHPDYDADLEIHRIPVDEKYKNWLSPEMIEHEKIKNSMLEGCFTLSVDHKIIFNFIHSQLANKGHGYGIVSFRDMYDLYLLSRGLNLNDIVPETGYKQKAIAYFAFAGSALGVPGNFNLENNFSGWIFAKKHEFNMRSITFYHIHRNLRFIFFRIFSGYFGHFFKSLYSKKIRKSIMKRLSSRVWYKQHLNLYKRFFIHQ